MTAARSGVRASLDPAPDGQVIYTAEVTSVDPESREELIHQLVKLLVTDLTKRGLLPPKP